MAATKPAGQIMVCPDELGRLEAGFLAVIVLADGDPLEDLSLLADPAKIQLAMKDGVIYKVCATPAPAEAALHLEGPTFRFLRKASRRRLLKCVEGGMSERAGGNGPVLVSSTTMSAQADAENDVTSAL